MLLRSFSRHQRFRDSMADGLEKLGYRRVAHVTKDMKRRGVAIKTRARSRYAIKESVAAVLPCILETFELLGIEEFSVNLDRQSCGDPETLVFSMYA